MTTKSKSKWERILKRMYMRFTPEIIAKWESAVKENPNAEYNCNKISEILPFVKKVMPRLSRNQSLFGLSIISIEGKIRDKEREEVIVMYGIEPLQKAGILTGRDVRRVVNWYRGSEPRWDSHDYTARTKPNFEKEFSIGNRKYRLITDNYRNFRDLNLQVLR